MEMYEHQVGGKRELFLGLALMAVGAVFLLDHLNVLSFSEAVRMFWPLILIWIGVTRLLSRSHSPRRIGDR